MARGVNKVIAIGNLGADPDTRYVPSGAAVTNFDIAVTEQWKDKQTGEQQERTEWIRCEVWGKMAEHAAQYLTKGSQVYIEGQLRTDKVEKDGETKYYTKVRVNNMTFLGGGADRSDRKAAPQKPAQQQENFDDDIPF